MLEAKLEHADVLKKVLEAVKELVTDANFDCSDEGIKLQAMDNSHVALVSLELFSSGFQHYRCDRNMSLGMSLASLQKIVKTAGNEEKVTLRADESADILSLLFENNTDRIGEYEMKLMDIDQEHLGIPDTVYDAEIKLPSAEFARIIRDLKEMGESVKIEVQKDGIRFSADGDIGSASVTLKPTEKGEEEEEEEEGEGDEDVIIEDVKDDDEEVELISSTAAATAAQTQDEKPTEVEKKKARAVPDDEEEGEEEKPDAEEEEAEAEVEEEEEEEEEKKSKKESKKRKSSAKPSGKGKKAKTGKAVKEKNEAAKGVTISMQQAVTLTFSIKYLSNFAKSTSLSDWVYLHMSNEVPLLVEYAFKEGHIRYYLAPKISDE